jgi:hypothetical protein
MSFAPLVRNPESGRSPNQPASAARVSQPGDALEREADRAAADVVQGRSVPRTALSNARKGLVQRQDCAELVKDERPKTEADKYKEAGSKLADAFLETDLGKKLKQAALDTPLVKGAIDFVATLPGKIVAGTAAAGAVSALAATHTDLPAQIPEIPLDKIQPGLKVKLTYEGPVDKPTKAMVVFTYAPEPEKKTGGATASEKYRAETARIAADQDKFRAGMTYKPGSAEDLQQKAEQKAVQNYVLNSSTLPGFGNPLLPAKASAASPLDQIIGLKPASSAPLPDKKEEAAPVQRKAANASSPAAGYQPAARVLSTGDPLDAQTRASMETKFGFDFSQVRVHTDEKAAASAKALDALAYTTGHDVVFAAGHYAPRTSEGRKLLAHELAHTIQQASGTTIPARPPLHGGSRRRRLDSSAKTTAE